MVFLPRNARTGGSSAWYTLPPVVVSSFALRCYSTFRSPWKRWANALEDKVDRCRTSIVRRMTRVRLEDVDGDIHAEPDIGPAVGGASEVSGDHVRDEFEDPL